MQPLIRTRFAPSPTGYIHVGNLRAALFPWLLARQTGGSFILRIEDTDQARFVEGATDLIFDTLTWVGMDWDEGPDRGGQYGPYVQTERRDHYVTWAKKLIDQGLAYADPYTPEEVEAFRNQAKAEKKAFLYRDHRPESPPVWDGTRALRFKVPVIKRYDWHDPVMGDLSAGPEALDDFILIKSDGLPTYNFAHIVDDTEMKVTHVIRGLEYISSIPKYLSLYDALGITWPVLVCLPHIMAPDGNKKLGKRDGAKSVQEYRHDGILPEAMLNFLASMGWNDGTEQEIFTRDELIEKFSLERVQRSGARFDEQRLLWMNGQHIRKLSLDDLYTRVSGTTPLQMDTTNPVPREQTNPRTLLEGDVPVQGEPNAMGEPTVPHKVAPESEVLDSSDKKNESGQDNFWPKSAQNATEAQKKQVLALVQDRLKTLRDLSVLTDYFFRTPTPDWTIVDGNKQLSKIDRSDLVSYLEAAQTAFSASNFDAESLQVTLNHLLESTGQKPGILFSLIRLAVSWAPFSPALNETLATLGKDAVQTRLQTAIDSATR